MKRRAFLATAQGSRSGKLHEGNNRYSDHTRSHSLPTFSRKTLDETEGVFGDSGGFEVEKVERKEQPLF